MSLIYQYNHYMYVSLFLILFIYLFIYLFIFMFIYLYILIIYTLFRINLAIIELQ